mgnify:FL=1
MDTLNEMGLRHQTDKASTHHCFLDNYERYIGHLRDKEFTLLEIGVASGASIRLWREYFQKAHVFGIDNNPDCAGEGIFIGDQNDTGFIDSVLLKIGNPDVVIDDGHHWGPSTIATFKHLFPKIAAKGYYFVEDCHCFYDATYGMAPPYGQGMSKVYNFFTNLAIDVDVYGREMTGNSDYAINSGITTPPVPEYSRILDSIHIYTSLRLFTRK